MLKIGKMTDYAVVLLCDMARRESRDSAPVSAAGLSARAHLPEPTVAKLLKLLAKEHILMAQRGVAGGYRLARPAAEVTVGDIITAIEGPIALTACVEGSGHDCRMEASCGIKGHWNKVNEAVRAALNKVTLAEMASADFLAFPYVGAAKQTEKANGGN
jgi:FeS assembly SUF system regulator